jgi:serine/threonine protein kinase
VNDQLTEARLLNSLAHPNIVKCADVFNYSNSNGSVRYLCIVQEYCDKGDLKGYIEV